VRTQYGVHCSKWTRKKACIGCRTAVVPDSGLGAGKISPRPAITPTGLPTSAYIKINTALFRIILHIKMNFP
jgi:hypothetical protein